MRKLAILAFVLSIGGAEGSATTSLPRQTFETFTIHGEVESATDANAAQGCASAASAGCAGAADNTTIHAYDALGRRIRTTRPDVDGASATTHTGYDLVGNITRSTDARGNITHFTVDALNRRTGQTDPADGEGVVYTQSWSYDQAGNAISHSDRRGIVSESRFDKENRMLGTSRAGLTLSTLTLDADGNVRTLTDALGRLTTTTFDKASRKVLEERTGASERWSWTPENDLATHTDADGRVSHSTYDLRRQLITETNPAGETTEHTYDGAGHRLTTQRPLGDADHRWVSTFDEGDRLATVSDPQGHTTTYRYDAHGNRTAILDANNHTAGFAYDAHRAHNLQRFLYILSAHHHKVVRVAHRVTTPGTKPKGIAAEAASYNEAATRSAPSKPAPAIGPL